MSETGRGLLWALPEDRRDAVRRRCPAIIAEQAQPLDADGFLHLKRNYCNPLRQLLLDLAYL